MQPPQAQQQPQQQQSTTVAALSTKSVSSPSLIAVASSSATTITVGASAAAAVASNSSSPRPHQQPPQQPQQQQQQQQAAQGLLKVTLELPLLRADQLYPTPSMSDSLAHDVEFDLRLVGCELIQTAGRLLKLPQVAIRFNTITIYSSLSLGTGLIV